MKKSPRHPADSVRRAVLSVVEALEERCLLSSIAGTVYLDANNNGVQDGADTTLSGWTVYIDANHNGSLDSNETWTKTDSTGAYTFSNLAAGDYDVRELTPNGYVVTQPASPGNYPVTLDDGQDLTGNDFGNYPGVGSITGIVFVDANSNGKQDASEIGLGGWKVYLDLTNAGQFEPGDPFVITPISGLYSFNNVTPGAVTVGIVQKPTWFPVTPASDQQTVTVLANTTTQNVNFGQNLPNGSISGTVYNDYNKSGTQDPGEPGMSGITVFEDTNDNGKLDSGEISTVTDANGHFSFTGISDGPRNYAIVVSANAGYAITSPSGPYLLASQDRNSGNKYDGGGGTGNQSNGSIAVSPSSVNSIFIAGNTSSGVGLFSSLTSNGGTSWWNRTIASGSDGLPVASGAPTTLWDSSGKLFLSYVDQTGSTIVVAESLDGGVTFSAIAQFTDGQGVDHPTLASANGQLWLAFRQGTSIVATSASISLLTPNTPSPGLFYTPTIIDGSAGGNFASIAVSKAGVISLTWQDHIARSGTANIYISTYDPSIDSWFETPIVATTTAVNGIYSIPAQSQRRINAAPTLAYDNSSGSYAGRLYLCYTDVGSGGSADTDVEIRYSDDHGATWSDPVRVNDDTGAASQFLPHMTVDNTTGAVGVSWYDCRDDHGDFQGGDLDGIVNDDIRFYASASVDGGNSFLANIPVSAGTASAIAAQNTIDFGDQSGLAFVNGSMFPVWADNSNSTWNNPNGWFNDFNLYTSRVRLVQAGDTGGSATLIGGYGITDSGLTFGVHDGTPVTAQITTPTPNPRFTPLDSMTITLNKPTYGFDKSLLQLTCNGTPLSLANATLTTTDNATYTLGNLTSLTGAYGVYVLTVSPSASAQDLSGNTLTTGASTSFIMRPYATMTGQYLFYNNSRFDGNSAAVNSSDDSAIATDKTPLLAGGKASFANYSTYSRGLNGIMVDISSLGNASLLSASDFTFKVSRTGSNWTTATSPTVTVRSSAGAGGSDRVELTWDDNVIQKQWLQVTVLADANTGLASPFTFYFGNAIGECGNSSTDAMVNGADEIATRNQVNGFKLVSITNTYDYDRDGFVTARDQIISRVNNSGLLPLFLITAPASPAVMTLSTTADLSAGTTSPAIVPAAQVFSAPSIQVAATTDSASTPTADASPAPATDTTAPATATVTVAPTIVLDASTPASTDAPTQTTTASTTTAAIATPIVDTTPATTDTTPATTDTTPATTDTTSPVTDTTTSTTDTTPTTADTTPPAINATTAAVSAPSVASTETSTGVALPPDNPALTPPLPANATTDNTTDTTTVTPTAILSPTAVVGRHIRHAGHAIHRAARTGHPANSSKTRKGRSGSPMSTASPENQPMSQMTLLITDSGVFARVNGEWTAFSGR